MIQFHRIAVLYCLNTLWQIPLLYTAAFLSDKLLRRSSVVLRHRLWIGIFLLCLGLPLVSATGYSRALLEHAFLHNRPVSQSVSEAIVAGASRVHPVTPVEHSLFGSPNAANIMLTLWIVWILYRTFQIASAYPKDRAHHQPWAVVRADRRVERFPTKSKWQSARCAGL
jgi:hypothetical protein